MEFYEKEIVRIYIGAKLTEKTEKSWVRCNDRVLAWPKPPAITKPMLVGQS